MNITFRIIYITVLLTVLISYVTDGENKKSLMQKLSELENPSYHQITNIYQEYWEPFEDSILIGARPPSGWKQYKRWEYFWKTRLKPDGLFPNGNEVYNEWKGFQNRLVTKKEKTQTDNKWNLIGPVNSPEDYNGTREQGLGRINVIRFDPQDTETIWIGSATGGIWKSTDKGNSWKTFPMTNFLSIGISDIAIYRKNTNILYATTGDDNGTYGTAGSYYSVGLIKSKYGGMYWETTNLSKELSERFVASRVLVHPDDENNVIVGTSVGIYKSTDGGDSWELKLSGQYIKDMEFMTDDASVINATSFSSTGKSQIYRSTDNGETWENTYTLEGASRIAITVSKSNKDKIWAVSSRADTRSFHSFLISSDRGASWDLVLDYTVSPNMLGRYRGIAGDSTEGQGNYDLCIAVNPNNEKEIYVGGINIWKSDDGGNSFERITSWTGDNNLPLVHADQHDLIFQDETGLLYSSNDGGIYSSNDLGKSWLDHTDGMSITQYYRIGQSKTNPQMIIGGCQDNGTNMYYNGQWLHLYSSDGMECAVNPGNDNILYQTIYYGILRYSTNRGVKFRHSIEPSEVGEYADWVAPYVIDETSPNVIYIGYQNIYRSTQFGIADSWKKLTDFNGYPLIALAIAPGNSDFFYPPPPNDVFVLYDGGDNWDEFYHSNIPITYIAVDPEIPTRLWVTLGNFYSGNKVIEINGSEVINISGNLPNVPVNCIVYQKDSPDRLFIGTDIGVFYTDYNSLYWEPYGEDLPNLIVNELEIFYPDNKLRAATYGRGIWETEIPVCNLPEPQVTVLGETELCEGDTLVLEAEEGYDFYFWSNGETGRILNVTQNGNYSVRIYDNKGCSANSRAISVEFKSVPDLNIIYTGGSPGFCANDSIRLTASLGFKEYLWSSGETRRTIYASKPGEYWVHGISSNDCEKRSEILEVTEFELPAKPIIIQKGRTLVVESGGIEIINYRWYLHGEVIEGADGSSFEMEESGEYFVEITDTNGCKSVSDVYDFVVGVEDDITDFLVRIYPNPGDGEYNIDFEGIELLSYKIEIINLLGLKIYKDEGELYNEGNKHLKLNLKNEPDGVYYIKVTVNGNSKFFKLIKN